MPGNTGKHFNSIFGACCYFVFLGWLVCAHQCTLSKSMLNSAKTYKYLEATYRLSYESLMGYIRSGKFISCEQTDICVYSNHPFYKTLSITINPLKCQISQARDTLTRRRRTTVNLPGKENQLSTECLRAVGYRARVSEMFGTSPVKAALQTFHKIFLKFDI